MTRTLARIGATAIALSVLGTFDLASQAQAETPTRIVESFTTVGSSHISSINAALPITPTELTATLNAKNLHILKGKLPITAQTVSFSALGVPLRATTTLVQASPITGALKVTKNGNILRTSVSYTIKLSNVEASILGQWVPLQVGKNCQTVAPAVISVSSPPGRYFSIIKGGRLTGTYAIGRFQDCAPLQLPDLFGLGSLPVNSLVPGTDNTVSLTLTHGHIVSTT